MTRLRFVLLVAAVLAATGLWPAPAFAQCGTTGPVCATRTTLSANVAADATSITVASATGFTVGNGVYVDVEFMEITAISGTTISVNRGQRGTLAEAHDNADGVITGVDTGGPLGAGHFNVRDPDSGADCTRGEGQASHSPWINIRTGWVWVCDDGTTADWTATLIAPRTLGSRPTTF